MFSVVTTMAIHTLYLLPSLFPFTMLLAALL